MKKRAGLLGSAAILIFVVLRPTESAGAVLGAMVVWAKSFVPALLPVFVVTPALSTNEAREVYKRALSRIAQRAFGIPGEASAAVAIGLMAGSPAGALGLAGLKCKKNELCRAGVMASGLSPAFLTAMGFALFGGMVTWQLALSQLLAILSAGWLLRFAWAEDDEVVGATAQSERISSAPTLSAIGMAAVNIAGVLCCMSLFAVISAMLSGLIPGLGRLLLPFLEVASGLASLTSWRVSHEVKLTLAAFVSGLGGLCVAAQNLSRMPFMPPGRLFLGKLLHATLTALYLPIIAAGSGRMVSAPTASGRGAWVCCAMVVIVFAANEIFIRRRTAGGYRIRPYKGRQSCKTP